jgi:dihydrolipoamide dehydrogenase
MSKNRYDLIIIGAGPGGYVAAIRAGQTGMKTALIEKKYIGGMCLNWGCIPSKSLLESAKLYRKIKAADKFGIDGVGDISFNWQKAVKRITPIVRKLTKGVESLLKKNGVEIIMGAAEIVSGDTVTVNNRTLIAGNIIIATGSRPEMLSFTSDKILQIEDLLKHVKIPENLAIAGSGAVAVELTQLFSMMDRKVTLLQGSEELIPGLDDRLVGFLINRMKKEKIGIVTNFEIKNNRIVIDGTSVEFDLIINASLRQAVLPSSSLDFKLSNGFLQTDDHLQTSIPGIYAVGDVNGKSNLAHSASAQGLVVVNQLQGIKDALDLYRHPLNIYTYPEIAQVGKTEAVLQLENIDFDISEFPLSANGKALAEGDPEGFLRILFDKKYGEVLGVQIVAAHATDLISEASIAMQIEATVYDVAKTVHAHPTVSEVFLEAGHVATGKPIHK